MNNIITTIITIITIWPFYQNLNIIKNLYIIKLNFNFYKKFKNDLFFKNF